MSEISTQLQTLYTMAMMVEARDAYTGGHMWRVSQFSYQVAKKLALSESEAQTIALAGFLHDLGKVGVSDAVLNKKDRLSDEEFDVIKTHPRIGRDLLEGHPLLDVVITGILHHHERPDGLGYPMGLKGDELSLMARIIGVTDAFDAMTSTRPYRAGMPREKASRIIEEHLGSQFDTDTGKALVSLGQTGILDHIIGHSEPGIPLVTCPACGPIIVRNINRREGHDTLLCPSCTGEFNVHQNGDDIELEFTGTYCAVEAKRPRADYDLIKKMTESQAPHMSI